MLEDTGALIAAARGLPKITAFVTVAQEVLAGAGKTR